jgi:hypothetical protein
VHGFDRLAASPDTTLQRVIDGRPVQVHLYAALRREQRAAVLTFDTCEPEATRILSFARSAYNELASSLVGREVLDSVGDGEWSLRDLLRHAIAVELRYRAQVQWSARRRDDDPVTIPADLLPCDRLVPPEPEFADTRTAGMRLVLESLGRARAGSDEELAQLDASVLGRPSRWGSLDVDVRERLHQIGVHVVEVVVQSEKMLGSVETEVRRIVRRIAAVRGLHEHASNSTVIADLDSRLERLGKQIEGE